MFSKKIDLRFVGFAHDSAIIRRKRREKKSKPFETINDKREPQADKFADGFARIIFMLPQSDPINLVVRLYFRSNKEDGIDLDGRNHQINGVERCEKYTLLWKRKNNRARIRTNLFRLVIRVLVDYPRCVFISCTITRISTERFALFYSFRNE